MKDHIISYLHAKYTPKTILLHGSRARGDAFESSDYDLVLITDNPDLVRPEYYEGHALDVSGLSPKEKILKSGNIPLWPCVLLFDDPDALGAQVVECTQEAYHQGPLPLTPDEIENRRNFSKRLIGRIQGRGANPLVRFYYMGDFYQRVLRYWCELNQKWPISAHRALPLIDTEDDIFYLFLQELWSEDYIIAAKKVHKHLFKEML